MSEPTTATCARCGDTKPLCGSCVAEGIQQPRICKDCLLTSMQTGDYQINDAFWLKQLWELGDTESIENLAKKAQSNE